MVARFTPILALTLALALSAPAWAAAPAPKAPGERDKCPVCGMFVAPFPNFLAQVVSADGKYGFFDGSKDMFKYLLKLRAEDPAAYDGIRAVYVTDYYTLKPVDGREAFYVTGSDVAGPMGAELIAFSEREAAEEFLKDHRGQGLLTFGEVSEETLRALR